jgi:hypothetical protein
MTTYIVCGIRLNSNCQALNNYSSLCASDIFGTSLRETLYHTDLLCIFVLLLDVSFRDKRAFNHSPSST